MAKAYSPQQIYWFSRTHAVNQTAPKLENGLLVQEDRLPGSTHFIALRVVDARGGLTTAVEVVRANFHPDGSISVDAYTYPPRHNATPVRTTFELSAQGEIISENGQAARDGEMLGLNPDGTLARRSRPLSHRSLTRY